MNCLPGFKVGRVIPTLTYGSSWGAARSLCCVRSAARAFRSHPDVLQDHRRLQTLQFGPAGGGFARRIRQTNPIQSCARHLGRLAAVGLCEHHQVHSWEYSRSLKTPPRIAYRRCLFSAFAFRSGYPQLHAAKRSVNGPRRIRRLS